MNMAVCLLAYALSLTVLGPGVLSRFTRAGAAPRFAIGAWLAVMGSVLVAAVAARQRCSLARPSSPGAGSARC